MFPVGVTMDLPQPKVRRGDRTSKFIYSPCRRSSFADPRSFVAKACVPSSGHLDWFERIGSRFSFFFAGGH
jgi:hypothetical protein